MFQTIKITEGDESTKDETYLVLCMNAQKTTDKQAEIKEDEEQGCRYLSVS